MSKILEVFVHLTKDEHAALKKKYTDQEIKWLISKAADKAIALECEKIENETFCITNEDESEAG